MYIKFFHVVELHWFVVGNVDFTGSAAIKVSWTEYTTHKYYIRIVCVDSEELSRLMGYKQVVRSQSKFTCTIIVFSIYLMLIYIHTNVVGTFNCNRIIWDLLIIKMWYPIHHNARFLWETLKDIRTSGLFYGSLLIWDYIVQFIHNAAARVT